MEFGLSFGANRVRAALFNLGETYEQQYPVFDAFIHDIPADIPFGRTRLLWNPVAMLATDDKLASIEAKYRREVLDECVRLIAQYSS
jgi:hypothetical protein